MCWKKTLGFLALFVVLTTEMLASSSQVFGDSGDPVQGGVIDVFVGKGGVPYPSPHGGQGPMQAADTFEAQETVSVWAQLTYNGDAVQSKIVTIIVLSPSGLHDFSRTATTNETGYAYTEFRIPWPIGDPNEIFGTWNITALGDIEGLVFTDIVWFKVTPVGDVNNDGKVDGQDLAIVAKAFGSRPIDPRWDSRADQNHDDRIDGRDVVIVANNFGKGI